MKPWAKSTGPKNPEGKAVVSRNAFTGGGGGEAAGKPTRLMRCHYFDGTHPKENSSMKSLTRSLLLTLMLTTGGGLGGCALLG